MATYKEIKGVTLQTLDSDPVLNVGSWSSGGSLNTPRGQIAGFGTTPAAGAAQGATPAGGPPGVVGYYEQYNGTAWTETTDINTAGRNGLGTGTITAGLVFGGWPRGGATETWNGSAWTEVGDMTRGANGSQSQAGGGTQTAAFAAGGEPGTTYFQLVETWNGSSWTEVSEVNTGRQAAQGFGITTAGYVASGYSPPVGSPYLTGNVEFYNGSSWTETTNVSTNRGQGGGAGNSTSGIIYTGSTGPGGSYTANTEFWNGSAWTELNDVSTARAAIGKTPNPTSGSTDALAIGGEVPGYTAVTEEWATPPPTAAILTEGDIFLSGGTGLKGFGKAAGVPSATWASGTSINTSRQRLGGAGLQTANVVFAGAEPSMSNKTEEWNGSAWTEKNDMNTARYGPFSFGVYNAAIAAAGYNGSTNVNSVESWDGTNWTEIAEVNSARRNSDGFGTATDGLIAGGITVTANCETWNGSSWTEVGNLNEGRGELATSGKGTTTAGIVFGGEEPSLSANTEEWNGSAWTELNNLNTARKELAGNGIATSALGYAGNTPSPKQANTEAWNGTSWTEVNDLSTGKNTSAGVGASAVSAMNVAGDGPGVTNTVEEWTADNALGDVTLS